VIATASGDRTRKRTAGFWAFWTGLIALAILIGALAGSSGYYSRFQQTRSSSR
jgi:hypothetical protein